MTRPFGQIKRDFAAWLIGESKKKRPAPRPSESTLGACREESGYRPSTLPLQRSMQIKWSLGACPLPLDNNGVLIQPSPAEGADMTKEELETMRLKMRLLIQARVASSAVALARTTPDAEQALHRLAASMRSEAQALKWPRGEPAMATLMQAEYSEALQEILVELGL
jgi:hypothetical protein